MLAPSQVRVSVCIMLNRYTRVPQSTAPASHGHDRVIRCNLLAIYPKLTPGSNQLLHNP